MRTLLMDAKNVRQGQRARQGKEAKGEEKAHS